MKAIKYVISLGFALSSVASWGYGTGVSQYPLLSGKRLISTEFTGVTSTGGGIGFQGRFTQKVNDKVILDGGLGISGGERTSRFFVGGDFEMFPDYQRQPRVSLRTEFENSKDFDTRRNSLKVAPTISKGFNFWGEEAYPFVAMPYAIGLDAEHKTYETSLNLSAGVTGNIPVQGYRKLVGTLETTVGIKDSFTAIFAGVSFPLN